MGAVEPRSDHVTLQETNVYFANSRLPCLARLLVVRACTKDNRGTRVSVVHGTVAVSLLRTVVKLRPLPCCVFPPHGDPCGCPGALTCAMNYYRQALSTTPPQGTITAPTLVLWGAKDHALGPGNLMDGLRSVVPNSRVIILPNATHWVHHDCPNEV